MNTEVRRKLEMAARVREFILAHSSTESSYAPVLARLEERLQRAGAIAARQHEGLTAARAARAHRRELRRVVQFQLLHYLVAVGSVAATDRAELAARFKLPASNAANTVFLTSVKALITTAREQKDMLMEHGMKPELLDDLDRLIAEFEAAVGTARTGRRDHIGARADLDVITAEIQKQIKVLDGITRYRFGMSPELMAEWKAVRRVPGQPKGGSLPKAGNGEVTPGPGGIAPAA
jgi:hypothetical protein